MFLMLRNEGSLWISKDGGGDVRKWIKMCSWFNLGEKVGKSLREKTVEYIGELIRARARE